MFNNNQHKSSQLTIVNINAIISIIGYIFFYDLPLIAFTGQLWSLESEYFLHDYSLSIEACKMT